MRTLFGDVHGGIRFYFRLYLVFSFCLFSLDWSSEWNTVTGGLRIPYFRSKEFYPVKFRLRLDEGVLGKKIEG